MATEYDSIEIWSIQWVGGSYSERGLFTASMISYDIGSFFVQLRWVSQPSDS